MRREDVELLAPAGTWEALEAAVFAGADAVYLGGSAFGARAYAENFGPEELQRAITFAHLHHVRIYVTVNTLVTDEEMKALGDYVTFLSNIGVDGIIVQDLGIIRLCRRTVPELELHASTQMTITNSAGAIFAYHQGMPRSVMARETTLKDLKTICQKTPGEIETFMHGALCICYSGQCLMSSLIGSRSGNRGRCAQTCRMPYTLVNKEGKDMLQNADAGQYLLSPKDMNTLDILPQLIETGVRSFKIEGRMKTPFYVGTVVKAYRQAIDDYFADPKLYEKRLPYYLAEVSKASHRDYTTAFYYGKPDGNQQVYTNNSYIREYDFIGMVQEDWNEETGFAWVEQRNKFSVGEEIEVMPAQGDSYAMKVTEIRNQNGETVASAPHPQELLQVKFEKPVKKFDMLRKRPSDVK